MIFWTHFLDFGDIMSIFRGKAPNVMQYAIPSENPIQQFSLPYNQLVRLEFAETKCAEFVTAAKLGLTSGYKIEFARTI